MEGVQESVFVSAIRSFCKVFFGVLGLGLAIVVATLCFALLSPSYSQEEKTSLTILPNLAGNETLVPLSAPAILRVRIHGVVGEPGKLDSEAFEHILLASRKGILHKDRVKAILLHMNTPGGTVIDSDNIYRMLKEYKAQFQIPIYAYVEGMCASGGMYISSAADKMYASPASIVGSVGVLLGPFFNFVDAMHKVGIQSKTLTEGIDKDALSPFRAWKPEEDASIRVTMAYFYQRFVDIMTEGRPRLDREKLVHEYGAKIFDPPDAERFGYIDVANASYKQVLADLMEQAKIDPNKPYQVVEISAKKDWFSGFGSASSPLFTGKIEHTVNLGGTRAHLMQDQFAYLYEPASRM
jgi:protease-4